MRDLGVPELVAQSESAYVDLAVKLAGDRDARSRLAKKIAGALASRPGFLRPEKYGDAMAAIFRQITKAWRARHGQLARGGA